MNSGNRLSREFIQALKRGDTKTVQVLLREGVNLSARTAGKGVLELIPPRADELKCLLIKAGARHPDLKMSLVWACSQGDPELVKALIDYGADLNQRARLGTPLMAAIGVGCLQTFEMLLEAGADPSLGTTMATPLSKAVVKNRVSMLERLLMVGCDPDLTPKYGGLTALHTAVFEDRRDCIALLLKGGADPNRKAVEVMTGDPCGKLETHTDCPPLHFALYAGNAHLIPMLLEFGGDPALKDGSGRDIEELARDLGMVFPGDS